MVGDAFKGPFLLGQQFCATDIYLLMLSQRHPEPGRSPRASALAERACEAVRSRPAIEAIWGQFPGPSTLGPTRVALPRDSDVYTESMKDQEFSESPSTGALPARPTSGEAHGILAAGAVLAFTYVGCLAATYFSMPEHFQAFVGLTITHIFFGRAAGISLGYALDYGFIPVVAVNLAIETVEVLLFYPMFVLSVRRLIVIDMLARLMERMHRTAEANQALIRRWGIAGLFCFVFIPFWMTGPLIGSVIGYLLGLRVWVN
ncbi:MAG: small multi-drug export protein, partial [Hyphomicrobium sp.]